MNDFNIGRAWSLGFDFIRRAPAGHAILLIVIGAIIPLVVQLALVGGATALTNPAMMGSNAPEMLAAGGIGLLAAMAIGYVFQTGAYFGSWRLGLTRGTEIGGAIGYGLAVGVGVVVLGIVIAAIAFALTQVLGVWAVLIVAILVIPLLAALYSLMIAIMCIMMLFAAVIAGVFGAAMGSAAPASNVLAGGLISAVVIILVALFFLWVTARFCCTAPAMAHRGSFNFVEALGESWQITSRSQGSIMLYYVLVGLALGVLFLIFGIALAAVAMGGMAAGAGAPQMSIGMIVMSVLMSVVLGYISVLIPAGIYRALQPDIDASAAVFE
jgi:hypothetical protein